MAERVPTWYWDESAGAYRTEPGGPFVTGPSRVPDEVEVPPEAMARIRAAVSERVRRDA